MGDEACKHLCCYSPLLCAIWFNSLSAPNVNNETKNKTSPLHCECNAIHLVGGALTPRGPRPVHGRGQPGPVRHLAAVVDDDSSPVDRHYLVPYTEVRSVARGLAILARRGQHEAGEPAILVVTVEDALPALLAALLTADLPDPTSNCRWNQQNECDNVCLDDTTGMKPETNSRMFQRGRRFAEKSAPSLASWRSHMPHATWNSKSSTCVLPATTCFLNVQCGCLHAFISRWLFAVSALAWCVFFFRFGGPKWI